MSRALIRALVARGMDVANAVDAGMAGASDRQQFEYAAAEQRVLYTFNVGDFYRLHEVLLHLGGGRRMRREKCAHRRQFLSRLGGCPRIGAGCSASLLIQEAVLHLAGLPQSLFTGR